MLSCNDLYLFNRDCIKNVFKMLQNRFLRISVDENIVRNCCHFLMILIPFILSLIHSYWCFSSTPKMEMSKWKCCHIDKILLLAALEVWHSQWWQFCQNAISTSMNDLQLEKLFWVLSIHYLVWGHAYRKKINFHLFYYSIIGEPSADSKVHGANMGPIWGWQDPGAPHVGVMNFAIWINMD